MIAICHISVERTWIEEYMTTSARNDARLTGTSYNNFAVQLGLGFIKHVKTAKSSVDKYCRAAAEFLTNGWDYFRFQAAIWNGCKITQEVIQAQYTAIFHYMGRSQYFNIGIEDNELYYAEGNFQKLQEICINCPVRHRAGLDNPLKPNDLVREEANLVEKTMPLKPTYECWHNTTKHTMMASKCQVFREHKYIRATALEYDPEDPGKGIRSSRAPRSHQEKQAAYEYYVLMGVAVERCSRTEIDMKTVWNTLLEVTTVIDAKRGGAKEETPHDEALSDGVDELMTGASFDGDGNDS